MITPPVGSKKTGRQLEDELRALEQRIAANRQYWATFEQQYRDRKRRAEEDNAWRGKIACLQQKADEAWHMTLTYLCQRAIADLHEGLDGVAFTFLVKGAGMRDNEVDITRTWRGILWKTYAGGFLLGVFVGVLITLAVVRAVT